MYLIELISLTQCYFKLKNDVDHLREFEKLTTRLKKNIKNIC